MDINFIASKSIKRIEGLLELLKMVKLQNRSGPGNTNFATEKVENWVPDLYILPAWRGCRGRYFLNFVGEEEGLKSRFIFFTPSPAK